MIASYGYLYKHRCYVLIFKNLITGKWFKESQSFKKGRRRKRIKETKRQRNRKVCIFSNCLPCHNISANYLKLTTVLQLIFRTDICNSGLRFRDDHKNNQWNLTLNWQFLNVASAGCLGISDAQLSMSTILWRM